MLFKQRQSRNMLQAAFTTLALIYHQTVYNLRTGHRNAALGLLLTTLQNSIAMMIFLLLFSLVGIRS